MSQYEKHRARKRFGQNFLQDTALVERMLAAMRLRPDDNVVEVGPGLGALTYPLLERLDKLRVIEIDRDLIQRLEARQLPTLTILSGDVLTFDFIALAGRVRAAHTGNVDDETAESKGNNSGLRIIGNLPYNIGTPLLIRLLQAHHVLDDIHVMLQKEVVDRLHASTNSRAYGRLSVLMQSVFDIKPLFDVPPEAFVPAPKVTSAVVRLKPRPDAPDKHTIETLESCTRLAFANKRKTLRNNLKGYLDESELTAIDINPQARAETLDLDTFQRLAKRLSQP